MTDDDAWEAHCAAGEGPPFVCNECGWTCDPSDAAEIEAHGEDCYAEWFRSQCPIPRCSRCGDTGVDPEETASSHAGDRSCREGDCHNCPVPEPLPCTSCTVSAKPVVMTEESEDVPF